MSVMGFQKRLDGLWAPSKFILDFLDLFNFAKPLSKYFILVSLKVHFQ